MNYTLILLTTSAILFFIVVILETLISRKVKKVNLYDQNELQELESHKIFLLGFTGELFVYIVLGLIMYGVAIFLSEPKSGITYAFLTFVLSVIFLSINIIRYRKLLKKKSG